MPAIAFSRLIGPVPIDCVISEKHESDIEITEIPIETGARITDHAFVLPKRVTLDVANENATASYNALVGFQETRLPFTLVTGLTVYNNMLIRRLSAERDKTFSQVLRCSVDLQEIIIVETSTVADPEGNNQEGADGRKSKLSRDRSGDTTTGDRTTGTDQRGDVGTKTVTGGTDTSLIKQLYGG